MPRPRLSTLLIAVNVGLLLLAVSGVAALAFRLLGQLADEQALAQVSQAAAAARNAVALSGQELQTDAEQLSVRPTLAQLLSAEDEAGLATYLDQFRQAGGFDGCAVLTGEGLAAESGLAADWPRLWQARRPEQDYWLFAPPSGPLLLVASADIPSITGASVMAALRLDQAYSDHISAESELTVTVLAPHEALAAGPLAASRRQALLQGEAVTARVSDPDRYLSIAPLRDPGGEVRGLIETELSAGGVSAAMRRLAQTLLLLTVALAAPAVALSLWLSHRLSRPLGHLTGAAARIGQGDLATPVPHPARDAPPWGSAEMADLALALEEMRRHLLQATTALQRQQAESQAILSGIVEGVFTVSRDRRIQYANPQAAAMLGARPEEVIGRFCGDVLNPLGTGQVRPCDEHCPILHARFQGGARATEHLRLPDGRQRIVVITSAPPQDPPQNGDIRQTQVIRDETDIEAARRLRDAVLANVSHEFRTPLSAQLASIEMLLDQLPDLTPDAAADLLRSLQRGTLRLTQLIDNLLESVRLEAGQVSIRRQDVSLEEVVEQAVEMTRPLLDQRGQEVALELPYPLPAVCGDAARLTQVFVNLLANANKYGYADTTVRVGGAIEAESVTLWVEDEGPGLPDMPAQALFSRFVRSAAGEPEPGGVGLGLWIVQSIVERHGGRVTAESRPGRTRMSVSLPRQRPQ